MTMSIEGLEGSTPWAAEVSGHDPFVDYTSNLSGLDGLDGFGTLQLGGASDYPEYLGAQAGRQEGFLADTEVEEEYLGTLQAMGEPGFDWSAWTDAERTGTVAGAALGLALGPAIVQRFSNAPMGYGTAVAGALAGAIIGNRWPGGGITAMSVLFGADMFGLLG